jgi:hypothetical protein
MHGWLNLLTMLYWNSGDSLVGKPAIDKYGEIEELMF